MKDVIRIIVRIQPQIVYHSLKEERLSLSLNYSKGITPSVPPPPSTALLSEPISKFWRRLIVSLAFNTYKLLEPNARRASGIFLSLPHADHVIIPSKISGNFTEG